MTDDSLLLFAMRWASSCDDRCVIRHVDDDTTRFHFCHESEGVVTEAVFPEPGRIDTSEALDRFARELRDYVVPIFRASHGPSWRCSA